MDATLRSVVEYVAFPKGASIWGALNAPITVAIVAAVFAWLLKDRVQEFVQDTNQFRSLEEEELPISPEQPAVASNRITQDSSIEFSKASAVIANLKKFIDKQSDNAPDGRNRRKYNNFPSYDYIPLVKALQDDGNLKSDISSQLLEVLEEWRTFRNGKRAIPLQNFEKMLRVQKSCQTI